jgi:hypothetical protein
MRKYWELLKADYAAHKTVFISVGVYWFVAINDYISSMIHVPDVIESNPFTRNAQLEFVLWKGLCVDLCYFSAILGFIWLGKRAIKDYDAKLGDFLGAAVYIYVGADRFLTAVIPNWLLIFRFYVAVKHEDPVSKLLQHLVNP